MLFQIGFVRQKLVQGAVETIIVDSVRGNTKQIRQRSFFIKMFGDVQFTRRTAEPAKHQDLGNFRPPDPFFSSWYMVPEKTTNFQSAHQLQAKPWSTEIPYLLNPHLIDIDFHPFRLDIIEQFALDAGTPFGSILNTQAAGLIHFTKPSHDPLPRSSFGSVGL